MTSAAEHRYDHDLFIDTVRALCQDPAARTTLSRCRGRRLSHCADAHRFLARHVFPHPLRKYAPRAHYTVAALIAATTSRDRAHQMPPHDDYPACTQAAAAAEPMPALPVAAGVSAQGTGGDVPAGPSGAPGDPRAADAARTARDAWRRRPNLGRTLAEAVQRKALAHDSATRRLRVLSRLSSDLLHPRLPALAALVHGAGCGTDFAVLLDDLLWWDTDRARITSAWTLSFHLALTNAPAVLGERVEW